MAEKNFFLKLPLLLYNQLPSFMNETISKTLNFLLLILIMAILRCNNSKKQTDKINMPNSDKLKTYSDPEQKIINDVKQFGFHVAVVSEDEYLPGFAYTIGLTKTYNHPEVIMFGLNNELMHEILNDLGAEIKNGKHFELNKDYENIISNYPVKLLEVKKEHYQDYFGYASWFYNNTFDFPAYQLIWTDKENNYPYDNGFNENWKFKQPILDRNTDFKFYEERNLGVFTTQETLNGKPILWVYHNQDGDWQFHSEENPNLDNAKLVSLESLVQMDSTLNELYYLNFGQSATRETAKSEWKVVENEE